jgi:hypothetical protein
MSILSFCLHNFLISLLSLTSRVNSLSLSFFSSKSKVILLLNQRVIHQSRASSSIVYQHILVNYILQEQVFLG